MITKEQVRAARALLNWTAQDLADNSGAAVNTIRRFENGADAMGGTLAKIEAALTAAGVAFIPAGAYQGEGGPGVRLKGEAG